jgi:antirestriction protein ArdC
MNIYESVTKQIIEAIEKGVERHVMPWHGKSCLPTNPISNAHYNGSNILSLWARADQMKYPDSIWATYKQWFMLGAQVNKGEKGTQIIFYQKRDLEDELDERPNFIIKASYVFNVSQTTGYVNEVEEIPAFSHFEIDRHIVRSGAKIIKGGNEACYLLQKDEIRMPSKESFVGTKTSSPSESYYGILLHELTHWSGAKSRLDRDLSSRFGTEGYAMEELVAELGSAFMCARLNLTTHTRPDHATYISTWLKVLKSDPKAIFIASSKASKAVEYLMKK